MRGLSLSFKNTFPMRVQWTPEMIPFSCARLVAWYDMSDASTMYESVDTSDLAEDGDRIRHVANKAYDGLAASSNSLNMFIANINPSSSTHPQWTAPTGVSRGYLNFTGSEFLISNTTLGQVAPGKMGGVTLTQENFTVSFVLQNASTTESADHYYFGWTDSSRQATAVTLEAADDQMHWEPRAGFAGVDSGTAYSGSLESWTIIGGIHLDAGDCGDGRFIRIFRNGVQVNTTDESDWTSYNRDLTVNNASVNFCFAHWDGSTNRLVGRVYEFMQMDKAISEADLEQLNTYYGVKYGIS